MPGDHLERCFSGLVLHVLHLVVKVAVTYQLISFAYIRFVKVLHLFGSVKDKTG